MTSRPARLGECATYTPNAAAPTLTSRPQRNTFRYPNLVASTPQIGPNARPTSAYGVRVTKDDTLVAMPAPNSVSWAMAGTTPFMMANTPDSVRNAVSSNPHVRRCLM